MATHCITQVTFQGDGFVKPMVARFDQPEASTDGGLVLLKAVDTALGLTARLAACMDDAREPGKVRHEAVELLQQRIFGLCAGYADCNDAARLTDDPIHKLMLDRDPISGLPTHGQQEFAFFNGHYDAWCYLPVVATLTFNDEPAQFAVAAVLRPGKAPAGLGARGIVRALLRKLRSAFPAAAFRVRLDGGFASAKLFTFLEREQVEYVVAMPSNRRLDKRAQRLMGRARVLSRQTGQTAHLYGETWYAAHTWTGKRRVIIKAEVVRHPGRAPKNNPRFVVTNLVAPPAAVYQVYCQRGDVENRLKELHHGLEMDRTSCSKFRANQFRVLLTLAAYILFQELRRRAATTADAQVTTLRERLVKLAVWVERSARRIVLHLPLTFPWLSTWRQLARAVGATT